MFSITNITSGTTVLLSKEDSWKLDSSMFCVQGSWETGYVYNEEIFFMVGVSPDSCYKIGESSPWINIPATTALYLEYIKQEKAHLFNQRISTYSSFLTSAQGWANYPIEAEISLSMMERQIASYLYYEYDPEYGSTNFLSCDL
jgi:hypothetical protein